MEEMIELAKFRAWGREGGLKNRQQAKAGRIRARKLSAKRRSEIARLGGLARALKVA